MWGVSESFEAVVDSLALIQYEHIVLVVSDDTVPPQISQVFISPILYGYYW